MKRTGWLFAIFGIALAAGLFVLMRPPHLPSPEPQPPPGATVPNPPPPVTFAFVVKQGARSAGPLAMQAREGEDIEIKVTGDAPDELHLHGYELHTALKPNQPAVLYFKATHSGRFELELHKSGLSLGALEIQPK